MKQTWSITTLAIFLAPLLTMGQTVKEQVEKEIADGNILGAVVMAGTPEKVLYHRAFGERDSGKPMKKNCIFDVSSITKPTTVGTSLAMLLNQGKISLDDKLSDYLPIMKGTTGEQITIRQAATHTSGIDNTKQIQKEYKGEELIKAILTYDTSWAPGSKYHYSCLGFIRLSEMIQDITKESFSSYCENNIFEPLGMKDSQFGPLTDIKKLRRMVKTSAPPGQIQDPNAKRIGRPVGNAGLFTTAENLSRIASLWLQKGTCKGRQFFSGEVWKTMTSRQTGLTSRGITWSIVDHSFAPENLSTSTFYHTGYNGHALWIDPEKNMYFIVLTVWKHPDIKASKRAGREARVRITRTLVDQVDPQTPI